MDAGVQTARDPFRFVPGGEPESEVQRNAILIAYREVCRGELGYDMMMRVTPDNVAAESIFVRHAIEVQKKESFYAEAERLFADK